MGSTSSGTSDTNIIRSRIAPKATCGSVAGVLATRSQTSVCGRTPLSLAQMGFVHVSVFRLPRRVVLLAEVGAGSQPTSRTVRW